MNDPGVIMGIALLVALVAIMVIDYAVGYKGIVALPNPFQRQLAAQTATLAPPAPMAQADAQKLIVRQSTNPALRAMQETAASWRARQQTTPYGREEEAKGYRTAYGECIHDLERLIVRVELDF